MTQAMYVTECYTLADKKLGPCHWDFNSRTGRPIIITVTRGHYGLLDHLARTTKTSLPCRFNSIWISIGVKQLKVRIKIVTEVSNVAFICVQWVTNWLTWSIIIGGHLTSSVASQGIWGNSSVLSSLVNA